MMLHLRFFCLCVAAIGTSMPLLADDSSQDLTPPKFVYDDLPPNWDYYRLSPDDIEKYKGEEKSEICFDDDLIGQTKAFTTHKQYNRKLKTSYNFVLLKGLEDFSVVDKNHLIVRTPETGTTLIQTKYCKKSLRRAKYLPLNNNIFRDLPNRCYKRHKSLTIMTRPKAGYDTCRIENMYDWTGSFERLSQKDSDKQDTPEPVKSQ